MFEHDCLDTCCFGCLICMRFKCLHLHLFSAIQHVSHGKALQKYTYYYYYYYHYYYYYYYYFYYYYILLLSSSSFLQFYIHQCPKCKKANKMLFHTFFFSFLFKQNLIQFLQTKSATSMKLDIFHMIRWAGFISSHTITAYMMKIMSMLVFVCHQYVLLTSSQCYKAVNTISNEQTSIHGADSTTNKHSARHFTPSLNLRCSDHNYNS